MEPRRLAGGGWLFLIGGGEFSFGETLEVDRAWLDRAPTGLVGFLPAASGSVDYGRHFSRYLAESFGRDTTVIPIYRRRDARRRKNIERIERCAAVYLGGGVADELLATLSDSPALEALARKLGAGGVIVAIAAAAQAMGQTARSMFGGAVIQGLGWLPEGVVEPNFDPGHDRRLRELMRAVGVSWGLGLPAGSALSLGPEHQLGSVGRSFLLEDADGDFRILH